MTYAWKQGTPSITRQQGVLTWAARWATLRAWGRDLSHVQVVVSPREYSSRLGTCWQMEHRLVVYAGQDMPGTLATLLHEYAHSATIGEDHGPAWQAVFASALTEVTGIEVVPCADRFEDINDAAKRAVRAWWRASGNALAWSLVGEGL